jgi:hypothetical protein
MKNVHDDLHIIEHDPLARWKSVDGDRAHTVIALETALDFARDRFQVRLGRGGANHEKIGEGRYAMEIENGDLLRFFIRREFGASSC